MRVRALSALSALSVFSVIACREKARPPQEFAGSTAFEYIQAQVAFGPRVPGTPAHEKMGNWLDSLLRARADTVLVQSWSHVTTKGDTLRLRNFIARFNPTAEKRLLFLAHWDSRPVRPHGIPVTQYSGQTTAAPAWRSSWASPTC
jgi:hypothetical protein